MRMFRLGSSAALSLFLVLSVAACASRDQPSSQSRSSLSEDNEPTVGTNRNSADTEELLATTSEKETTGPTGEQAGRSTSTARATTVSTSIALGTDPRLPEIDWFAKGLTQAGWATEGIVSVEQGCTTLRSNEFSILVWPIGRASLAGTELTYADEVHETMTTVDITKPVRLGIGPASRDDLLAELDPDCPDDAPLHVVFSVQPTQP